MALHVRLLSSELRGVYVKRQQKDKKYGRKDILERTSSVCVGGGWGVGGLSMDWNLCLGPSATQYFPLFIARCSLSVAESTM